jgi:hypothetical protein
MWRALSEHTECLEVVFVSIAHQHPTKVSGGGRRDRTDDLMLAKHALSQLSYAPVPEDECSTLKEQRFADAMLAHVMSTSAAALKAKRANMVGLGRLELPTSRLSSARSNQLSYKP